jgi:hypothetical protein
MMQDRLVRDDFSLTLQVVQFDGNRPVRRVKKAPETKPVELGIDDSIWSCMASLSRAGHFEIPVKIEVRAGYHQVGRFLSLLGSEGCVVKVEGFALAGDRTGAPIITASIDARAYFLKTGLGQERIGELLKVPKSERSPVIGINEYKAKHRDPFLPAGAAEAEVAQATGPAFRLKGIVWDEKKPLATIMDGSGAIYFLRQGEKIGTDLVLSIKPNSVTLRRANGARYELKTWE